MYRHQALIQYAVTFLLALLTTAALSAEPADRSVKSTSVGADRVEGIESFVQRFGAIDATRPGAEAQRQRLYAEMSRELDLTSPSLFSSDSGDHCKLACEQTNVAIASLDIAKGFASEAVESCADPNFYAAEAKYFADVAYATAVFAADLACKQHPGAASFILNARTRASKAAFEAERSFLGRLGSPKVQQCDSIDYHAYVALAVRGEASLDGCAISSDTEIHALIGASVLFDARQNALSCNIQ